MKIWQVVSRLDLEKKLEQAWKIRTFVLELVTSQIVLLVFLVRHGKYNDFDNQNYFFVKHIYVSWIVLDEILDDNSFVHSSKKHFVENYLKKTFELMNFMKILGLVGFHIILMKRCVSIKIWSGFLCKQILWCWNMLLVNKRLFSWYLSKRMLWCWIMIWIIYLFLFKGCLNTFRHLMFRRFVKQNTLFLSRLNVIPKQFLSSLSFWNVVIFRNFVNLIIKILRIKFDILRNNFTFIRKIFYCFRFSTQTCFNFSGFLVTLTFVDFSDQFRLGFCRWKV